MFYSGFLLSPDFKLRKDDYSYYPMAEGQLIYIN